MTPASLQGELFRLIVCPACSQPMEVQPTQQDNGIVAEGRLGCACGRTYSIRGGIPRLLPEYAPQNKEDHLKLWTQKQFGFQWTAFHEISCDFRDNFFISLGPISPEFFQGKIGLDAGCGFGRHLIQAARCGARMVGLDYSRAIESSSKNTKEYPNIALVQGDLEKTPFRPGSFDFAYSIGVLHHLPDPFVGFASVVRQVRPGGSVFAWCYSDQRRWSIRLLSVVRFFTTRLPRPVLRVVSILFGTAEWVLLLTPFRWLPKGRFKAFLARQFPRLAVYAPYPFQVVCADWFDRLAAPIRHYLSARQLEDWCARTGLQNVRVTPTGVYGWTLYAEKPPQ